MGWIVPTPAGTYRVNWRDPSGQQRAKTVPTKREAKAFLARVEADASRGTYVDPHAGRVLLGDYAADWLAGRTVEARTQETTQAMLRTHVLPRWGDWPLTKIDHLSVQQWVAELATRRKPATVVAALGVLSMILSTAVRARLLPSNPCDGVRAPRRRSDASPMQTITRDELHAKLLPVVPERYRVLICLAAGAGLRWGECAGLAWDAVNLDTREIDVHQVAVETSGPIVLRPYPKSRAGVRRVPLPRFAVESLREHRLTSTHPGPLVVATRTGTALRRSTFRRRVWMQALAAAGLPSTLRFHDLRHSYATWLVTDGVPVNIVQRLMGHEQASTTLNRYVHAPRDYDARVRDLFDDDDGDAAT